MKKNCFSILFFIIAVFLPLSAQKATSLSDEEEEYALLVSGITQVQAPYLKGNYIIFTQENTARAIGIAFDFEDFREVHQFKIKQFRDADYEVKDSLFFYILKLPKSVQTINYRIVVDGLWTTDPQNANKKYNKEAGIVLSQIDARRTIPLVTEKQEDGRIRFVYLGSTGQKIRLGGSFTNWDSWIYELTEFAPGQYQCYISLPPGTYQYAYYIGVKSFPDKTNPERCYTIDGKEASLLIVQ